MYTFVDSSWYQLRYTSPHEPDRPWDPEKLRYWCPVDQYTGGAEHAVMHLLYARFFIKALRDMGLVAFGEPFTRLFNQGQIVLGGRRMSKSRGNVVAPDSLVLLLAPLTPHIAEELWARLDHAYSVHVQPWPAFDPALAADDLFECVIQVNGKVRDRIEMPVGASEEEVRTQVLASARVQAHLNGKSVRKFIYVPG